MNDSLGLSLVVLAALPLSASGCDQKDSKPAPAAAAVVGCGTDYTDPAKEFCLTMPAGYKVTPEAKDELYSELLDIRSEGKVFNVSVGFTNSNFKTFDDELKDATKDMTTSKEKKVETSGKPPTGTGQWWTYTWAGSHRILSVVKSNGDKALRCTSQGDVVAPEIAAACKSLRAYPK